MEETQKICKLILREVVKPSLDQKNPDFFRMADVLVRGMWFMNPFLKTDLFLAYAYYIVCDAPSRSLKLCQKFVRLNLLERLNFWMIIGTLHLMRFRFWREYNNFLQKLGLWLMPRWPMLAYLYLGTENARFSLFSVKDE